MYIRMCPHMIAHAVCVYVCRRVSEGPLDLVEVLHPLLLNQMKLHASNSAPSFDWCVMVLNPAGAGLAGEVWRWLLRKFGQSEEEAQSCDRQVQRVVVMTIAQGDISRSHDYHVTYPIR